MTKYPNREALRKAHDIYRDAMRPFIIRCLKRFQGETVENLIFDYLDDWGKEKFEQKLEFYNGSVEAAIQATIDIKDFPYIIKKYWFYERCFKQEFDSNSKIRGKTETIVESRNRWAHPGIEDVDLPHTQKNLTEIAEVLGEIKNPDAKCEVENIRDQLLSDKTEEHGTDVFNQLETARTENAELEKLLKDKSDQLADMEEEWIACDERLKTVSIRLEEAEVGKAELEKLFKGKSDRLEEVEAERFACDERLQTESTRLKIAVAEKAELEKRLETISGRLKDVEKENTAYQKRIETFSDYSEVTKAEKTKYEKALKTVSNQLATLKRTNAQMEASLETTLAQLEGVKEDLKKAKKELAERKKPLPPNPNTPDFVIFQGTTFIKHLDKYCVKGDAITQSFWRYWRSLGPEGKEEIRDAGWSVEKVDDDYWEITVSPEDFAAWIEDEGMELGNLLNTSQSEEPAKQPPRSFYGKTVLPTNKEIEQPALRVLSDGEEHRRVEIIDYLTEYFLLDDDQRRYISKTGQVENHLMKEGLIERTRTGYYRITTYGLDIVDNDPF